MDKKALFLDLDYTIIMPKFDNRFPVEKDDWKFVPGILERIWEHYSADYDIIIVSNQAYVMFYNQINPLDWEEKINTIYQNIKYFIQHQLAQEQFVSPNLRPDIDKRFYIFYTGSIDSIRNKPNIDFAKQFNYDLAQSIMVGDASGKVKAMEIFPTEQSKLKDLESMFNWRCNFVELIKTFTKFNNLGQDIYYYESWSDVDKAFAEAAGIGKYIDISIFLKDYLIKFFNPEEKYNTIKYQSR